MTKIAGLLIPCLFLAACQGPPPTKQEGEPSHIQGWGDFMDEVGRMDAQQLLLARESAMQQYAVQPDDTNRLKAGYVLSRTPASPQQLEESRAILAEISAGSELAPMRDLLDGEISKFMEVQAVEARTLELREEFDALQAELVVLQEQLDALKNIETEMVESQEEAAEMEQ